MMCSERCDDEAVVTVLGAGTILIVMDGPSRTAGGRDLFRLMLKL